MTQPDLDSAPIHSDEPEITSRTPLVWNDELNPAAVGWMRRPLVDTSGVDGRHTWGRNKLWEYWNVVSPTHILAMTISSIDYAAVLEAWVLDRRTLQTWHSNRTDLLKPVAMPPNLESEPVRVVSGNLQLAVDPMPNGTRLRARFPGVAFDVLAGLPESHERLGVVVPWSKKRFQYTVKDVARPASGWVETDGVRSPVPTGKSWATLDHGRGRWPYDILWNWGAGAGEIEFQGGKHVLGIQVGDKWTDGTGMTENSIYFDGRLTKVGDLTWEYDIQRWWQPWYIFGPQMELTFEPFYNKQGSTDFLVLANRTDQCFGTFSGQVVVDGVGEVLFEGLTGWAEEVHNRW